MRHFFRNHRSALVLALLGVAALSPVFSLAQETISFRIVVVETEEAAARLLEQLARGENFVALAGKVSIDPSAAAGGLVGPVAIGDLRPQLRSVLDGLRPGEMSAVVRVPTGFAIVKRVPDSEADAGGSTAASSGKTVMGSFTSALGATGSVKY